MIQPAIETHGLTKSFKQRSVLRGVEFWVDPGTIFALLGSNGAGKTTLVRILATLGRPDAGTARIAGFDVVQQRREVRRRISLTGQYAAVDEIQTGLENLTMMGKLSGLSSRTARARAAELLARFELSDDGRRRVGEYSGGMRRRLDLAASLMSTPEVIFLDEPTTGLDLPSRQAVWQMIGELVGTGATVFLTTQYLEEADVLADRIAVLNEGRIIANDTAAALKSRIAKQRLDLIATDGEGYIRLCRRLGDRSTHLDPERRAVAVATDGSAAQIRALLDDIDPHSVDVASFAVHEATLGDVFLTLTKSSQHTADRKENVHA
ncbi:ATP-binding cassette domain-containing protein [Nocardia abscessus]|uniref:ATP-binding cassette domain-containing protein n=1 Tax=Nocardia abscessus TaxID=120957 RepID=A0ABS0CA31_9NOCA|nr:ATP-binding cassette domain-containing protein [Nocardia abscessus]MBF6227214.1 ATP-binding cassette domain-containing protein [Nocardia abscessus]